jgi:hypothetical protein
MSPSRVGTPKDHNGPSLRDWGRSFLRLRVFIPDRRHHPGVNRQAAWAMRPSHRRILHSYFRAGCGSSGSRHKCEHINHITLNYIGFLRLYIPCAMALRLMPGSPRRRIRFASVADGLKDCSDPVGSTHLRRLDTSNGCRDHTVLPYASAPVVRALCSLTDDKPALRPRHAPDAAASTATRPSFVTMANAPLSGTGWARCRCDLGVTSSKISVNRKFCNIKQVASR